MNKTTPSNKLQTQKFTKISKSVNETKKTVEEINEINKVISETLFIKDNVAIDYKNFSLISITPSKDLLSTNNTPVVV